MKKLLSFSIFVAIAISVSACGLPYQAEQEPLPYYTAYYYAEDEEEVFDIIKDLRGREIRIASGWPYIPYDKKSRLMQEYNITFTELLMYHGDIMPTLQASVATNTPFADIVLLGGDMVLPAITSNLIYAVEEFLPHGSPYSCAQLLGFNWTFMPYQYNLEGMFLGVNLDIVGEIPTGDEWTFESFFEIMYAAIRNGYFGISGVPSDIIPHLIAANDGVMTYNYQYAFDDLRTQTALRAIYRIFSTGLWRSDYGIHNWHDNFFAFTDGRSAFFPISEWALQQTDIGFNYAIIPFPKGPDNNSGYSFMKGFGIGIAIPRGTANPEEVYEVFKRLLKWADVGYLPKEAADILQNQGKFDIAMAIPAFNWMHGIVAEGFYNGTLNVTGAIQQFRQPQQDVLNHALTGWIG